MSMEYIRKTYGVPAKRGGRVEYNANGGKIGGTIRSARGPYIYVQLDGDSFTIPLHPTWQLRYLDEQEVPGHG